MPTMLSRPSIIESLTTDSVPLELLAPLTQLNDDSLPSTSSQTGTVSGSSDFFFMRTEASADTMLVSSQVCSCSSCLEEKFIDCEYGAVYYVVGPNQKVSLLKRESPNPVRVDAEEEAQIDVEEDHVAEPDSEDCMDDDDDEVRNDVRKGLVGPVGCNVAVLPDRRYKHNFWVYQVISKEETTFQGKYFEQTSTDKNMFKDTGITETDSYSCVFYSDVIIEKVKDKLYKVQNLQFQEMLTGCVLGD